MQNTKTDRLEARISRSQRSTLERAARLAGTSLSAFVIDAALDRAARNSLVGRADPTE